MRNLLVCAVFLVSCGDGKHAGQEDNGPPPDDRGDVTADAQHATARSRVKQLSAGSEHACALFDDGAVLCWGNGSDGRLGTGSIETIGDNEPASEGKRVDLGGPAVQISAGEWHTCAVLSTASVRCWGAGADGSGRLGYETKADIGDDEAPAEAAALDEKAVQVAAGGNVTCALLESGAVRCWGAYGYESPLGYGRDRESNDVGDNEPVTSLPPLRFKDEIREIIAGMWDICVLFQHGGVRCWGPNEDTYSSTTNIPATRKRNVSLGALAITLGRGLGRMCAVTSANHVRCWGQGDIGDALGYVGVYRVYPVPNGHAPTPSKLGDVPGISDVVQLASGGNHTCVLLASGKVRCWGNARTGALGYGGEGRWGGEHTLPLGENDLVRPQDSPELNLPAKARQIVAGESYTCALLEDETVRCWGRSDVGQLGYGRMVTEWDAAIVPPVPL